MRRWFAPAVSIAALLWTSATASFLLIVSVLIVVKPRFPLNLGMVKTTGMTGLPVTLVPAAAGLTGILLFLLRRRGAAALLSVYSFWWAALMASGFPAIWNAKRTFCLDALKFCIISPWVARITLLGIVMPFLLSAIWFLRSARHEQDLVARTAAAR